MTRIYQGTTMLSLGFAFLPGPFTPSSGIWNDTDISASLPSGCLIIRRLEGEPDLIHQGERSGEQDLFCTLL